MNLYTPTIIGNSLVSGSMYGSNARYSGSFSGSFIGNGAGLTGISSTAATLYNSDGVVPQDRLVTFQNSSSFVLDNGDGFDCGILFNQSIDDIGDPFVVDGFLSLYAGNTAGLIKVHTLFSPEDATFSLRGLYSGSLTTRFKFSPDAYSFSGAPLQIISSSGNFYLTSDSDGNPDFSTSAGGGTHAVFNFSGITVNREYTFPDRSGTIQVGENYKVYTAILSQSGTSDPTATVLENTLGGTVVWTRSTDGLYYGTLTGAFTSSKTWCLVSLQELNSNVFFATMKRDTNDRVALTVLNIGITQCDPDTADFAAVEIRVYP